MGEESCRKQLRRTPAFILYRDCVYFGGTSNNELLGLEQQTTNCASNIITVNFVHETVLRLVFQKESTQLCNPPCLELLIPGLFNAYQAQEQLSSGFEPDI